VNTQDEDDVTEEVGELMLRLLGGTEETPEAQTLMELLRAQPWNLEDMAPELRARIEKVRRAHRRRITQKPKLDSVCAGVLEELRAGGWEPGLTEESYRAIVRAGFRRKTLPLAFVAADVLCQEQPNTLRQLFYRLVSLGWLPSTDKEHYQKLGRLMTELREAGIVPFAWLVDHLRTRLKPSSWSGLADFGETVRDAYRKNFWEHLPVYVEIFVEKDAIAGVLQEVTEEYDVALTPIRGFVSLSLAHSVAATWAKIHKPIRAYYLGDHDPSGLALEADFRNKLERYCRRETRACGLRDVEFTWERLAVLPGDFDTFDLRRLPPKETDHRTRAFRDAGHEDCAELDAIPAPELRDRVRRAITAHIPADEWERLQQIESLERETVERVFGQLGATP
jgi:hypothetical protein